MRLLGALLKGEHDMKTLLLSAASLALMTSAANAADLPSRKDEPLLPPMWTGFYVGLNAGYGFGTNSNTTSSAWGSEGVVDHGYNAVGGMGPVVGRDGSRRYIIGDVRDLFLVSGALPTGTGLAQSGLFSSAQSGFIGGGQIGYSVTLGSAVVAGLEADIQGAGIRGAAGGGSGSASALSYQGYNCNVRRVEASCSDGSWNSSANSIAGATVSAGIDWLGTVRGRLGYLWMPSTLIYVTGGLTYGGAYASVNQVGVAKIDNSFSTAPGFRDRDFAAPSRNYTLAGGGSRSSTLAGWNIGGGLEWMFSPNWSLKAEAIYWNMGSMNVSTYSLAPAPVSGREPLSTFGTTRVNYQGVIARAGVNYHFNWGPQLDLPRTLSGWMN